jgi:hypothetical protein
VISVIAGIPPRRESSHPITSGEAGHAKCLLNKTAGFPSAREWAKQVKIRKPE